MTTLAQYPRIRAALADAAKIEDVLPIIDEIEHVRLYARQIEDQELLADAAEYQMRAERRLGDILCAAKAAGYFAEGRPRKSAKNGSPQEPLKPTLADVGVGKKLSSRAQQRSGIGEQAFEAMVMRARERIASGAAKIVPGGEINGARAIMGSRVEDADSLDYSPTPPYGTRALIERVLPHLGIDKIRVAWEPACGEGHIAEVLAEYGTQVLATDIHDYGYGQAPVDFLSPETVYPAWLPPVEWIVTNPPFKEKAEQFALRALEQASVGVAIFARLQWLETIGRYERLFKDQPPTLIAFFCERINLCMGRWDPDGGTATAYIWLVWVKGERPRAPFWIPPGCRKELSRPDDVERFTAHPVIKKQTPKDSSGHEISHDPDGVVTEPESGAEKPAAVHELCSAAVGSPGEDHQLDIPPFLDRSRVSVPHHKA